MSEVSENAPQAQRCMGEAELADEKRDSELQMTS